MPRDIRGVVRGGLGKRKETDRFLSGLEPQRHDANGGGVAILKRGFFLLALL